ncbi:hypothetical protein [Dysgonomonas sp.]|jgi:hypothetical protein
MKTDLYTKIVLTVIAVALTANLLKDIDFVTKAHAGEKEIDLSALKIEKAANANNDEDITLFIYENSNISEPFSASNYENCRISYKDIPSHIITNYKINRGGSMFQYKTK